VQGSRGLLPRDWFLRALRRSYSARPISSPTKPSDWFVPGNSKAHLKTWVALLSKICRPPVITSEIWMLRFEPVPPLTRNTASLPPIAICKGLPELRRKRSICFLFAPPRSAADIAVGLLNPRFSPSQWQLSNGRASGLKDVSAQALSPLFSENFVLRYL
jgi:hypothetical protein